MTADFTALDFAALLVLRVQLRRQFLSEAAGAIVPLQFRSTVEKSDERG